MTRTKGSTNRDHAEKRAALGRAIAGAVFRQGPAVSLHELARAADVTIPTLKHYFGTREGAIAEALRGVREDAARYLAELADPGRRGLASSLEKVGHDLDAAWVVHGLGAMFGHGLAAGLDDDLVGPGYLDGILEPTTQALEARLRVHATRGELDVAPEDEGGLRAAAIAFLSPLLVVLLHQHGLSGHRCRPLDVPPFIDAHVARFVRAYGAAGAKAAPLPEPVTGRRRRPLSGG